MQYERIYRRPAHSFVCAGGGFLHKEGPFCVPAMLPDSRFTPFTEKFLVFLISSVIFSVAGLGEVLSESSILGFYVENKGFPSFLRSF